MKMKTNLRCSRRIMYDNRLGHTRLTITSYLDDYHHKLVEHVYNNVSSARLEELGIVIRGAKATVSIGMYPIVFCYLRSYRKLVEKETWLQRMEKGI